MTGILALGAVYIFFGFMMVLTKNSNPHYRMPPPPGNPNNVPKPSNK